MAATERRPLLELLPAVFREGDARADGFLGRFLAAFETVFGGVEDEIDALPRLFSLAPTPSLRDYAFAPDPHAAPGTEAHRGSRSLYLDSAAGICPGDVVQVEDVTRPAPPLTRQPAVEFVRVLDVRGGDPPPPPPRRRDALPGIVPRILGITSLPAPVDGTASPLRFDHLEGAPVRLVGAPGAAGSLEVVQPPTGPRSARITLEGGERLGAVRGDVLRIGEGAAEQYVQVVALVDVQLDATRTALGLEVTPALAGFPTVGMPVALMEPPSTTTPAPALLHAVRTGPELLLEAPARASDLMIELDTVTGLAAGDVLRIDDRDAAAVEVVRIAAMPAKDPTLPARLGVRLERRLAHDHPAGAAVFRLVPSGGSTLADGAGRRTTTLTLASVDGLGLVRGDALLVDAGGSQEVVRVAGLTGRTVRTTGRLEQAHAAGAPVAVLRPASGGTGFLAWLAGAIGLVLRSDRGERWNRELLRDAGSIWPWRGTRRGVQEFLQSYVRGEADVEVVDPANPMQLGVHSTIGDDAVLCGHPSYFWVELCTEERNSRMYQPTGLLELIRAARDALRREAPAHLSYDLVVRANTMRLGGFPDRHVGARLGDTTLLWSEPLVVPASEERSTSEWPTT